MNKAVTQSDLVLLFAPVACLLLFSLYRRREGIQHFVRRYIVFLISYLLTIVSLVKGGFQPPIAAVGVGVLVGLAVERLLIRPRSRYIPASVRRRKIAEYELRTGKKFNSREHELDHDVAFARGGSSTADNLRVRPRTENRRKGKKSPWWDVLGR